jgi:hypothetical protein
MTVESPPKVANRVKHDVKVLTRETDLVPRGVTGGFGQVQALTPVMSPDSPLAASTQVSHVLGAT